MITVHKVDKNRYYLEYTSINRRSKLSTYPEILQVMKSVGIPETEIKEGMNTLNAIAPNGGRACFGVMRKFVVAFKNN